MIYKEDAIFRILILSALTFFIGFASPLKAQTDTTVVEEAIPAPKQSMESAEDYDKEQPASNRSFISPKYGTVKESYSVSQVPNPKAGSGTGYISDPNDYLSAADEQRINTILYRIEQVSSAQVAVVFLRSIGDEVPKQFATELFEEWGIGPAQKDNGLLILNVMDQRRTEIEVGYGLEGTLPDVICFRILNSEVVPNFKNGNYGAGMIAATNRIKEILEDPSVVDEIYDDSIGSTYEENEAIGFWGFIFRLYWVICVLILVVYLIAMWAIDRSKEDYYDKYKQLERFETGGCLMFLFPIPLLFFYNVIKKRLEKYRKAPRFSRQNGKKMTLLNAWAENEFLEKAQILEEKIDSVEYDVWTTETQDDILILEYKGANSREYSKCKECTYKTFGRTKTKIIKTATYDRSGKRKIFYKCKNCHYEEVKEEVIPQKTRSSSSSSSGSSFSSSSGGSSSFGGGSSGGGGSGASW